VAETIAFGGGSFNIGDNSLPGTEQLRVREQRNGIFRLSNTDRSTILNLGIQGSPTGEQIRIDRPRGVGRGPERNAVIGLNANFDAADDILEIRGNTRDSNINMGPGNDSYTSRGLFINSNLDTGDGNDVVRFNKTGGNDGFVAVDSTIDLGAGDDILIFGGNVRNTRINLGTGSDSAEFRGRIVENVAIDLGTSDGAQNQLRFRNNTDFRGVTITGADQNDILFIGSSRYEFQGDNRWVNADDSNDVRLF
jgi:hypothetical protein